MNKKKIKAYFMGLVLCNMVVFGCTACAAKEDQSSQIPTVSKEQEETTQAPETSDNSKQETGESVQNEVPFVEVSGVAIKIGDDFSVLKDSMGEPDDYQSAKSCTGEGDEKIYGYGGISIYTTPSDKQDVVYILELTGDEKLSTGIGLGSSKQEVINVYGESYTEDGDYISYEYDSITLGFELEGDTVSFIEIYGEL